MASFEQPLGGIVAGRRSLLRRLPFETDYGVDVGLLIDAAYAGARLAEADIGHVEHDSQPLEVLGDMATQVTRTILDSGSPLRPAASRPTTGNHEIERRMEDGLSVVWQKVGKSPAPRLVRHGRRPAARSVRGPVGRSDGQAIELSASSTIPAFSADERTRCIAAIMAGVPKIVFEQLARETPLTPGASETVVGLRRAGFRVGVITDSYRVAAEIVRRRVFADFSISHLMKFHQGVATGEVIFSPAMFHAGGCPIHLHCKSNAMVHLLEKMNLVPKQVLAVGDGQNDVCSVESGWKIRGLPSDNRRGPLGRPPRRLWRFVASAGRGDS